MKGATFQTKCHTSVKCPSASDFRQARDVCWGDSSSGQNLRIFRQLQTEPTSSKNVEMLQESSTSFETIFRPKFTDETSRHKCSVESSRATFYTEPHMTLLCNITPLRTISDKRRPSARQSVFKTDTKHVFRVSRASCAAPSIRHVAKRNQLDTKIANETAPYVSLNVLHLAIIFQIKLSSAEKIRKSHRPKFTVRNPLTFHHRNLSRQTKIRKFNELSWLLFVFIVQKHGPTYAIIADDRRSDEPYRPRARRRNGARERRQREDEGAQIFRMFGWI
ncbi:hypothetical protein L596_022838 [Steinernema carpocapsae]|uniref:Uncharacterized protein n=1 Tax=Steinernema carpocapsae TaxID=34508 RepID=A0A4U5MMU1_STECR|nr:hypothetical protein L596_022838 [Steinernema carpocapsae]